MLPLPGKTPSIFDILRDQPNEEPGPYTDPADFEVGLRHKRKSAVIKQMLMNMGDDDLIKMLSIRERQGE